MPKLAGLTLEQLTALRRRRQYQIGIAVLIACIVSIIAADHIGIFGYHGNDWANFDGKTFTIQRVDDAGHLIIQKDHRDVPLQLIGVIPPADLSLFNQSLSKQIGKTVTLKLEPLQTQSKDHQLRCFVYLTEEDCLNVNLLHDGLTTTDFDEKHALQALTKGAVADAKKHKRGMWK